MIQISGIPASRGIAIGPLFQFRRQELTIECCPVSDTALECARFQEAVNIARQQLSAIYETTLAVSGSDDAAIFEAHLMMLDDPELHSSVEKAIKEQGFNAEFTLYETAESIAVMLASMEDEYFSARAADVRDVSTRVLRILLGINESPAEGLVTPSIVVAHDLTPSDTIALDKSLVLGFCTAVGGATSHTAILARGLGLPAVVGVGEEVLALANELPLILDGSQGNLIINPDEAVQANYREQQVKSAGRLMQAQQYAHEPAVTADGHQVEVVANIGSITDAQDAQMAGAEGVGLLRSEFLYLQRDHLPDEEEQYQVYRPIAEKFGQQPVILRTLDVGGDKEIPYIEMPLENNPFLGVRAIRLCLARPELFKPQLRAALRAAAGTNLKLMFPMVAAVEEVRQARAMLESCRDDLITEGFAVAAEMEIGIMIEIPSAALMADQLALEVDFFSIGTNDLAQYTMAADRTNRQVAPLASAFEPAVLRLIRHVINAAHKEGKWVGLCGELAGEPLAIPILLGLGLDEFSMNPPAIPLAKQIIRSLTLSQAQTIAHTVLNLPDAMSVQDHVRRQFPEIE
ncbi:MAG: phosphoenolpyruvate--protein phosphotransferase [Candidatus Promineifilaceae bacterium]|nr:phosphoenolpyruvate--protein phosphotransferase [Candidatus Promineifilaceae bacterium]